MTKISKENKSCVIINTCFGGKIRTHLLSQNNIKNLSTYNSSNALISDLVKCIKLGTSINKNDQILFHKINETKDADDAIEDKYGKFKNKPFSIYKRFYQTISTNFNDIKNEEINEYFIIACKLCIDGGEFSTISSVKSNPDLVNILNKFIASSNNRKCYKDLKLMIDYANIDVNQYDFSNLFHNFNKTKKIQKFDTTFNEYQNLVNNTPYGIIKNNNIDILKKDDFDLGDENNILISISDLEEKLNKLKSLSIK